MAALVVVAMLGFGVLAEPRSASAQMYRWTDDSGETHFTEGLESVPPRFRPRAVLMGDTAQPASAPPAVQPTTKGLKAPAGGARIEFTPGKKIVVEARINGRGSARLILDTGADGTLINPVVLNALGVSYRNARPGRGRGIGGTVHAYFVRVETIEIGEARFGPLMVMSHDIGWGVEYDGLLGRDFLNNFAVSIDSGAGVVILSPKGTR
ncbi:MAG TPA: aspartyl protease family protein [Methylomirabilota bacterium]|nr:aspartyl protease family protein [Methylomirabilota bacterium]